MQPLIAHVVHRFSVGGLENGIVNLINRLPAERWRHAIVSLTDISEEFRGRIKRDDVIYRSLGKPPGHLVAFYPHLVRLFRELRPSIVHTRNLAALEASVPACIAEVPVRIHGEHGWDMHDLGGEGSKYSWIRRLYRPFVHRYVALSRDLENYLAGSVGIPRRKIVRIYNGVDTERFTPAAGTRPPISRCPFTDPHLWLVGTVGRMEAVKDPLNLAHAFLRALEIAPTAAKRLRLVIVGSGSLQAEVLRTLQRAGLARLVWLAGERADIPDVMRGLDCFVLPSLAEGISNTVLEAMATGLPVIATRVGGNSELIEPGATGQLVRAADSDALAFAILAAYSDPAKARRQGQAARRAAESSFALDGMVARYDELYVQMLGYSMAAAGKARSEPSQSAAGT
jgi:sugar transferase (PEP-CTERM/EpsH1 system associated)